MAREKCVVVTGASTGIGWGTVKVLLARGFRVYGSVRKQSDADRLQPEFGANFSPLLMDVTDEEAVQRAASGVAQALGNQRLAGLVNNAGIAIPGPLLHLSLDALRQQMEVNLIANLSVTQAFAPLLGTDPKRTGPPGRIVQMSSVAGKMGVPFLGAYVASKHALEGMSESLRRELLLYGIDVVLVGPGSVATPIWDKAEAEDYSEFSETDYAPMIGNFSNYMVSNGRKGFPPEHIGEIVLSALTDPHPKVRYAVVPQRWLNWTLPMSMPRRLLDKLIGRRAGLIR